MHPYFKERLENIICFLASEHQERTKEPLYQTSLYKYLAFFEVRILKKTGQLPLGLKYLAMERGPVPADLYNNRETIRSDKFRFISEEGGKYKVQAIGKPDLDYLSDLEVEELKNLIEIFAQRWIRTKVMSDASHQDMVSWKKAYNKRPNTVIDFKDEFPDIEKKSLNELSAAEERFLMERAIQELNEAAWT